MSENPTISEKELLDAIKNLLKKSGHLNKFQAEVFIQNSRNKLIISSLK